MYTTRQLISMNCDKKYSASKWIKNAEDNLDDKKIYKLYATREASLSSGRIHIALPSDKVLTAQDYVTFNIITLIYYINLLH